MKLIIDPLLSKKNIKYFVEELQGDYYCLSTNNDFEKDLILEIYDKEIDSRFLFNETSSFTDKRLCNIVSPVTFKIF